MKIFFYMLTDLKVLVELEIPSNFINAVSCFKPNKLRANLMGLLKHKHKQKQGYTNSNVSFSRRHSKV